MTTYWRVQHAADPISADHRSQIGLDDDDAGYERGTSCCRSFAALVRWAQGCHANWLGELAVVEFEAKEICLGTDGEPVVRPVREVRRIPFTSTRQRLTNVVLREMANPELDDDAA